VLPARRSSSCVRPYSWRYNKQRAYERVASRRRRPDRRTDATHPATTTRACIITLSVGPVPDVTSLFGLLRHSFFQGRGHHVAKHWRDAMLSEMLAALLSATAD
jgi:hypothetical protein